MSSTTTALTDLTTLAAGDKIMVVDVSDTTMSANGTNKDITAANFNAGMAMAALSDVNLTGIADGDFIEWDSGGGEFVKSTPLPMFSTAFTDDIPFTSASTLFNSLHVTSAAVTLSAAVNREYWMPFLWAWNFTPTTIGFEVTTLQAASQAKAALYLMGTDFSIGARVCVSGDLATTSTGEKTATPTFTGWAGRGWYWVGLATDVASVGFRSCNATWNLFNRRTNGQCFGLVRDPGSYASCLPDTGSTPALSALSNASPGGNIPVVALG